MKKLLALFLTLILFIPSNTGRVFASFEDQTAGGRAPGMADSFVAVADDADAIAYNPAGLVQLTEGQVSTQYGQYANGLSDGSSLGSSYLGAAIPLVMGKRSLGLSYQNFKANNLLTERTLILSYGQRLSMELLGWKGIYSGGVNVKQLYREYQPDRFTQNALNDGGAGSGSPDPLFGFGKSRSAYAMDAGGLVQFGPHYEYTAGLSIINLNQPDVSLAGDGDKAPRAIKTGAAYRPKWGTVTAEMRRVARLAGVTDSDLAFGLERNVPFGVLGSLILRGGYATGSRGYRAMTAGMSYNISRFQLHYAFKFPLNNVPGSAGSHQIGLAIKIGDLASAGERQKGEEDLLRAFGYNSLSAFVALDRLASEGKMAPLTHDRWLMALLRKYPLDDPGLTAMRGRLTNLRNTNQETYDWSTLQLLMGNGVPAADKARFFEATDMLIKGDRNAALARVALMSAEAQRHESVLALSLVAYVELAAEAYRAKQLSVAIDNVRAMVEVLPNDVVLRRAYRQLLALKNTEDLTPPSAVEALPDAPAALTAPQPAGDATPASAAMREQDDRAKSFGIALGYYLMRKSQGATVEERRILLQQMLAVHGQSGLDMSIVTREMSDLGGTTPAKVEPAKSLQPAPATTPTPPAPTVVPFAPDAVVPTAVTPATVPTTVTPAVRPVVTPTAPTPVRPSVPAKVAPTSTTPKTPKAPAEPNAVKKSTQKSAVKTAPASSGLESLKRAVENSPDLERAWDFYRAAADRNITDSERLEVLRTMKKRFPNSSKVQNELERIERRQGR